MEVSQNITKQQNIQVQQSTEIKSAPKPEVKAPTIEKPKDLQEPKVPQETDAQDLVDTLNKSLSPFNTSIKFGFDNSNDVFFVSVIDTHTNDTIRRFPLEQAETLVGKVNDIVGIIFDEKG